MKKTLGVSGIIASGKSTFVKEFLKGAENRGIKAYHFDADKKTSDVLKEHSKDICTKFSFAYTPNFLELKKNIKEAILKDPHLNNDYQTYIWDILKKVLENERDAFFSSVNEDENAVFVFDAAFLFSATWDSLCDIIVKVVSDSDERKKRFMLRENGTCQSQKDKENAFFLEEKAFESEKIVDIYRNRKIIYTLNNTNTTLPCVLELEVKVVFDLLF